MALIRRKWCDCAESRRGPFIDANFGGQEGRLTMRAFALGTMLVLVAGTARAQDVQAGHQLAATWCSACHQVEAKASGPVSDTVPSFAAVAAMSSTTALSLRVFLMTPHPAMPNFTLSRREIADVSAYILSLRPPPARQRQPG
jgi:mono/diheme cytochrome c family protein